MLFPFVLGENSKVGTLQLSVIILMTASETPAPSGFITPLYGIIFSILFFRFLLFRAQRLCRTFSISKRTKRQRNRIKKWSVKRCVKWCERFYDSKSSRRIEGFSLVIIQEFKHDTTGLFFFVLPRCSLLEYVYVY